MLINVQKLHLSFTKQLFFLLIAVFVVGALTWWWFSKSYTNELISEQLAVKAKIQSTQLAISAGLVEAVETGKVSAVAELISKAQKLSDADFITVSDINGIRMAHPIKERVGLPVMGGDIDRALYDGESYLSHSVGSLGPSVRYITPIFNHQNKIIGMIKVGYLVDTLEFWSGQLLQPAIFFIFGMLVFSTIFSYGFSQLIRSQMQQLEPWQLVQTLHTNQSVLQAIHEGILAIDKYGCVYLENQSALELLNINCQTLIGEKIADHLDDDYAHNVLATPVVDKLVKINGQELVMTCVPVNSDQADTGVVYSFRSHKEIKVLSDKLSQVKQYVESIRVLRHETSNKLSIIAGLLQTNQIDKALYVALKQSQLTQCQLDGFSKLSNFPILSALLLGKKVKANEKGIRVDDSQVAFEQIPSTLSEEDLSSILGNLIDNAMECFTHFDNAVITVCVSESKTETIIRVANNGPMIQVSLATICQMGFSTKQEKTEHGIGMYLVNSLVMRASGYIELDSDDGDTLFSLYFPKDNE
ncbi:GHKL domain-containing protein [Vibrio sp. MA40-2]|uniref:GHKL domain-containing protein n=1 Tax=Vibrio sp. MA40-2 TaxID=3391828 RepID=UPI0039A4D8E2